MQKKNKRIIAKKNDNLPRKIRIYENGNEVWIQVRGNRKAATIARYHGATGRLLSQVQTDAMKTFENQFIIDSKGKKHKFETNLEKLQNIVERKRGTRIFFNIFQRKISGTKITKKKTYFDEMKQRKEEKEWIDKFISGQGYCLSCGHDDPLDMGRKSRRRPSKQ